MSDDPVVLVIGPDATRVGVVVADLAARGLRAGAFVGDPASERDALVAMLAELYGTRAALFLGDPTLDDDRAALEEMIDELFRRNEPD